MPTIRLAHRPTQVLLVALLAGALALTVGIAGQSAGAQEDGTTSTTQLDLGGDQGSTTTAATDSTTTTTTTQLSVGGQQAPTRVDAGAGGTATDSSIPLPGVALAGSLIAVIGVAALKVRREVQA